MTKAIFVGELYYSDLTIGGGPIIPPAQPPGYWGGIAPPLPTHPIAPGGTPPGIWGGAPPPYVDIGGPGPQPPTGGVPPGYWGGVAPPLPTHPIGPGGQPPQPTHPIVMPPGTIPGLKPEHPIYIPPPTSPGVPTHPIVMPPPGSTEPPEVLSNWDVKTVWTAQAGWMIAIVPSETHPGVPTPSEST